MQRIRMISQGTSSKHPKTKNNGRTSWRNSRNSHYEDDEKSLVGQSDATLFHPLYNFGCGM